MTSKTFIVPNISCGHCVHTIKNELSDLEGVSQVVASEDSKEVTVTWDESRQSWEDIRALLEEINYAPA